MKRQFHVHGGHEPVWFDIVSLGPFYDRERRTMAEAVKLARRLMDLGYRGVVVSEGGNPVVRWWPMCAFFLNRNGTPRDPDRKPFFPVWICGRHDLYEDGYCAEHTTSTERAQRPGQQLSIPEAP